MAAEQLPTTYEGTRSSVTYVTGNNKQHTYRHNARELPTAITKCTQYQGHPNQDGEQHRQTAKADLSKASAGNAKGSVSDRRTCEELRRGLYIASFHTSMRAKKMLSDISQCRVALTINSGTL